MRLPAQLHRNNPDTHKGDYGYCLVLGGSPGLTGAVCLTAQAALRAGCGLVKVGIPKSLNNIFEIKLTEVMSLPLPESKGSLSQSAYKVIEKNLAKVNVLVIGPGAGLEDTTRKLILKILKYIDRPMVIDADGITALASDMEILKQRKTKDLVITPHYGEFSRLIKLNIESIKKNRKQLAKRFARRYNLTLVLKGHRSIITDGKKFFENTTGNPGMATAGMGDVLSGMIGSLLAQGLPAFAAAKFGVYLHGLAGDLAAKDKTQNCLIASDVIDYFSKAFKRSL